MSIIRESAVKRSSDEPPSFSPSFPPGRFSPIFSSLLFLSLSETRRFFSRFKARPILGIDGRRGRDFPLPEIAGTPRVFFLDFIRSFNEAFNEEEKDASRRNGLLERNPFLRSPSLFFLEESVPSKTYRNLLLYARFSTPSDRRDGRVVSAHEPAKGDSI